MKSWHVCLLTVALAGVSAPGEAASRKWTDVTGTFSVEAELVGVEDGKAQLKRADGKVLSVPIEKLSDADREFIEQHSAAPDSPESVAPRDLTGKPKELAKDNGKPAGKRSLPQGFAVAFEAPEGEWYLTSVRIHGSRYGYPAPPREDFHVTLCDPEFKELVDFPFAYKLFQRGEPTWVTLRTKPTKVPPKFVLCVDFKAEKTKGVYVSHDVEGTALVGKPGEPSGEFTGGDWLIRVNLDQRKEKAGK